MSGRIWIGTVESRAHPQTIRVAITTTSKHPKYGKYLKSVRTYFAHNDLEVGIGDVVKIEECPKISKTKSKKVIEVIRRSTK